MAYFDENLKHCMICRKTFLGCVLSQPYEGEDQHPYITDNLAYVEYCYEKKNPQLV